MRCKRPVSTRDLFVIDMASLKQAPAWLAIPG